MSAQASEERLDLDRRRAGLAREFTGEGLEFTVDRGDVEFVRWRGQFVTGPGLHLDEGLGRIPECALHHSVGIEQTVAPGSEFVDLSLE